MALSTNNVVLSIVAFFLSLGITAETVIVVLVKFSLTQVGPYTAWQRSVYTTVTTIIASTITAFISSQIRGLWIAHLDLHFVGAINSGQFERIEGKWQTVLGVGKVSDQFRFWNIGATYLVAGLITTSVVASLNPTISTRTTTYSAEVSLGLPWQCARVTDKLLKQFSVYEWPLGNGSFLSSGGNWGNCPPRLATAFIAGINTVDPSTYVYSDQGVAVKSTAIGAPISIFGFDPIFKLGKSFSQFLDHYGNNISNTTQCVRVMTSNPVSCHAGGTVSWASRGNTKVQVTSDDETCDAISPGCETFNDPSQEDVMVKKICPGEKPGQATIVLGGTYAFGFWLSFAMNDPNRFCKDRDPDTVGGGCFRVGYSYAVTCHVDVRNVFSYREVTLNFQDSQQRQETKLAMQLSGDSQDCASFDPDQNLGLFGSAISANWASIAQNDGFRGYIDSIMSTTVDYTPGIRQPRQPPYAFQNSQNPLEDTLGLIIAMSTSRLNGTMDTLTADAVIIHTRVGSGSLASFAYCIPPAISSITLLWLLVHTLRSQQVDFSSINLHELIRIQV
ncbi:hypothetical protein DER44DRAFT_753402 [Fusarium oxysporum]|nr:hypothetical protein DER44DRAFT_753402 [Fusarium oxysporum]